MDKTIMISMLAGLSIMSSACAKKAATAETLVFPIQNSETSPIGQVSLRSLKSGGVKVIVEVEGLTPGVHAMHFHETGLCTAPDFKSSGGHYNPTGVAHGNVDSGPHAGDMMNVVIGADGTGRFEITNAEVSLNGSDLPALLDADGTALVIHAGPDDYKSQPSGAAGPRVACAAIIGK